jgi:hypothetical protein
MNCHDVLPWLETGGPLQRRRAVRHLRDCPKCRAAEQALAALKSELGVVPPLSAELQQRWIETADTPVEVVRTEPVKNRRLMWSSVAVAACVLIAVAIMTRAFHIGGHGDATRLVNDDQKAQPEVQSFMGHENATRLVNDDAGSSRRVREIKIVEVDPATEFDRIDDRLGEIQADVAGMAQDAQRLLAQQQIERLLTDHRNWLVATERQPLITP